MNETMTPNLTTEEYWALQPFSVEGVWMIQTLVTRHFPKLNQESKDVVIAYQEEGPPVYWIRKKKLSPRLLGKMIGRTVEQLKGGRLITLKVTKPTEELPEPNVPYWGNA